MPDARQAQLLQDFANEIFDLTKEIWAAQSRSKDKPHFEVSETEFLALDILARSDGPRTVGEIQREIGVLPAQMSRILRSLESKGEKPLVHCAINQQDKRRVDVELTPDGREAHQLHRRLKLGSIQQILEGLSETDLQEFMRLLRTIRRSIRKHRQ